MGIHDTYYEEFSSELQNLNDADWIAFAEILTEVDDELLLAITEMRNFWDLDKCPEKYLPFLSYPIRANIYAGDSDRIKRKKIWSAVDRHHIKGTSDSAKTLIEDVTGVEPVIYSEFFSAYSVWESKNNLMPFPHNFMRWSSKALGEGNGLRWASKNGGESGGYERGIIYIDLRVFPLAAKLIEKVVDVVKYFGATYFRYHIGYLSADGWIEYQQIY